MEQYCIYLRKSRADAEAEARGEGETLSRHQQALLEFARHQSLKVVKIYREIVSGETIAARPVMQALLAEVEQGLWAGVLVMEVERLARGDTMDQGLVAQTFKYSATKIITPLKTYDPTNEFDEEYFEFGLFMSRREYKTINRRLQRGRLASAKEGKYVASRAPFGYEKVKIQGDKGYTLKIVPEAASIVRLIFSLYVEGEIAEDGARKRIGIQQLAKRLNEMHIPSIRHSYWQKETIRDILTNPVYNGKIRWNWRPAKAKMVAGKKVITRPYNQEESCLLVNGLHKAIIDEKLFLGAQEYLNQHPVSPVGQKKGLKNPLAGLLVCGKCGHKMVRRKGGKKAIDYLVCHEKGCSNVSAPFYLVEDRLMGALKEWFFTYRWEWSFQEALPKGEEEILTASLGKVQKRLHTLQEQQDTLCDLLEQKVYTAERFRQRTQTLKGKIEETNKEYEAIEKNQEKVRQYEEKRRHALPSIEDFITLYRLLPTVSRKNELLKALLEKVVYTKEANGCFRGNTPDEFSLALYPKLQRGKK
ncbi:MAG TPA: recombinase family protein [Ruminococcaceae bacterium]|nr:recombinase family protein [Oscillospiraceae bacterium]